MVLGRLEYPIQSESSLLRTLRLAYRKAIFLLQPRSELEYMIFLQTDGMLVKKLLLAT